MTDAVRPSRPWSGNQGRALVLVVGAGFALVVWAWTSAQGGEAPPDQVPQLVTAIAGCGAVIVGAMSWIGTGRTAVRTRSSDVFGRVLSSIPSAERVETVEEPTMADATDALVVVAGTRRYHRADCLLVRGKPVERGAVEAGRVPCEMCTP